MLFAMGIAAVLCVVIGTFPGQTLYRILPFEMSYSPYDATHVLTQIQLLFFGAMAFVGLQKFRIYPAELRSTNLDVDWVYRGLAPKIVGGIGRVVSTVDTAVRGGVRRVVRSGVALAEEGHGLQGPLARSWPTRSMLLWVAILLFAFLFMEMVRLVLV